MPRVKNNFSRPGKINTDFTKEQTSSSMTGLSIKRYKTMILEACDRLEKEKEFKAQHGPVKVIMKDGKMLE